MWARCCMLCCQPRKAQGGETTTFVPVKLTTDTGTQFECEKLIPSSDCVENHSYHPPQSDSPHNPAVTVVVTRKSHSCNGDQPTHVSTHSELGSIVRFHNPETVQDAAGTTSHVRERSEPSSPKKVVLITTEEQNTRTAVHSSGEPNFRSLSVISRPTWTLREEYSPTTTAVSCVRSATQSFTKITDEDDETTFVFPTLRPGSLSNNPSAQHQNAHHHHAPHTTFFLPRIYTDPCTSSLVDDPTLTGMMGTKSAPVRRGSMIVRSGRSAQAGGLSNVPEQQFGQSSGVEGFIVTPFAQVLVSMQRIRYAFIRLTAAQSTNHFGILSTAVPEPSVANLLMPENAEYKTVANETLAELEWCLKQLENIQTKRPVSDMAFSKFKRLLNRELNSFSETDKSRNEISAYICGTFLEDEKDAETDHEIEAMLEKRRSSGQSHGSSGAQDAHSRNRNIGVPIGDNTVGSGGALKSDKKKDAIDIDRSGGASQSTTAVVPASTPPSSAHASATADATTEDDDSDSGSALSNMPVNGIVTPHDGELSERFLQTLNSWGADVFEIDRLSGGHALTTTAYRIFQSRDLLRIFSIDPATLVRYLLKVESNYHSEVPYHNSLHAADVTQTSHYLLQAEALEDVFSDLEILAVIFASIVHDVDHPGLTNQYLINTGHDLALQYNDASVLENHHLYVAFKLLNDAECDIFSSLTGKKRQTLRRMVIELVLATDMSKHMSLLADLRTMVESKKVSGSGVLNLDNYADRIQILQNMIHCADLSNSAKPLRLNRIWTSRLMKEFFRQGDKERALKIEISPMCDRESVAVEKSQVTFIDFVAHPLLESWCDLVHPAAQIILDTLADNRDWYLCQSEGPRHSGVGKTCAKLATADEDEEEEQNNES